MLSNIHTNKLQKKIVNDKIITMYNLCNKIQHKGVSFRIIYGNSIEIPFEMTTESTRYHDVNVFTP